MSLISLLHSYITPELVQKISGVMGESQSHTQKAIDGIIPSLVGGFVAKATNYDDASRLYEMTHNENYDGAILTNLREIFSGGESTTGLMAVGAPLLTYLFGGENKVSTLVNSITHASSVKSESASGLLGLLAPIAMAALEKTRMSQGLNVSGLINYLIGQKDEVAKTAPASLAGIFGIGSFSGLTAGVADSLGAGKAGDSPKSGSGLNWILPILGMAIFGVLVWAKSCNDSTPNVANAEVKKQEAPAPAKPAVNMDSIRLDSAKKAALAAQGGTKEKTLSSGVKLNFKAGSIEDNLIQFIEDKTKEVSKQVWFDFDNLLFDTGKATLQAGSMTQLQNVAEILKAFPQVEVKIGGYTDNVGDQKKNLKLSNDRATTVLGELVKLGIEPNRLKSEGYGDQHAVASNDTEEGRAKNRRISINVTKK